MNENMVITTKFKFESRLCRGEVLSPITSVVLSGNRFVNFANMNVSLRYLILSNYCRIFTLKRKGEHFRFFNRVLDEMLNLALMYPKVR